MNSRPTQGLWTIEPHGEGYALYAGRDAYRHGYNLLYITEADWNWENNKRLIEAAPDMLLALSWLVGLKDERPPDYAEQKPLAWAAARAALAKARAIDADSQPV